MELKKNHKRTELGVIPSDWEVKTLGDLGEVRMCKRVFNHQTKSQGSIPFYKIGTFGKEPDAYISQELFDGYRKRFSFPKMGDILISAAGTIGRRIVYDGQLAYFQDSNIVWIDNDGKLIPNEFLYYVFETVKYNTEGGTIQRLYNNILRNTKFVCPTKPEQTAIATALSDADALINCLEKLIEKKRRIKTGVMQGLLKAQKDWEPTKMSQLGDLISGNGFPIKLQGSSEGRFPFYKVSDMNHEENKMFMNISNNWVTESSKDEYSLNLFPMHSVVWAKIGAAIFLERKRILSRASFIDNNMMGIIINTEKADYRYIYYLLNSIKLGALVSTSALPSLAIRDIANISFAIPSKEVQNRISNILTSLDDELDKLQLKLHKVKKIKQGMMQNLLTGKIRLI